MPHPFGDDEPLTIKRVQRRLAVVIQFMPTHQLAADDRLLTNLKEDLVSIQAALNYLQEIGQILTDENGKTRAK